MTAAVMIVISIMTMIVFFFTATGFGKAAYAVIERFPRFLSFLSGAIVGALFGLIPGAGLGWLIGSRIVGGIICALCAAGAGFAWMRLETPSAKPHTKAR